MPPRRREKYVTNNSQGVEKTGKYGGGKVGSGGMFDSGGGGNRGNGGGRSPLIYLLVIALMIFGGGSGLSGLFSSNAPTITTTTNGSAGISSGWVLGDNRKSLDTEETGNKYTTIKGNNKDTITMMVYMCGTDLESRSAMATNDLQEMVNATTGKNMNVIIYTGGCARWQNNVVSSSYNQIYQIQDGKLYRLEKNDGHKAMTDPTTLTSFIQYCNKNFPANRRQLILWDHGGGSISGYGYDEKYPRRGAMSLAELGSALKKANTTFDYIGFDACLMATAETGLVLSPYADYLIGSEETEPGIGWYYTNWMTALGKNTSMSTVQLGKLISDEFVNRCASKTPGQSATLSVIDLSELKTFKSEFATFAKETRDLISDDQYATLSKARTSSREFSRSAPVDSIDLAHFANNLGKKKSSSFIQSLLKCVKYNNTSSNMTNAYGLAIYFPYKKTHKVDTMVNTYEAIGMDEEYTRCIQEFAKVEVTGQASYGQSSPIPSFNNQSAYESIDVSDIFSLLMGIQSGQYSGYSKKNTQFMRSADLSDKEVATFVANNQLDLNGLEWNDNYEMTLTSKQWNLIQGLDLNMYYDDGEGYIDLGLDNLYTISGKTLKAETDRTWLAINGQPVAYYHLETEDNGDDDYTITGKVPALLNKQRVDLILIFDQDHPHGYIAGARPVYTNNETDTIAKGLIKLEKGDKLRFLCDYYTYEGKFVDSYYLGKQMTVTNSMEVSNVDVGKGDVLISYRFRDIYNNDYWSPALKLKK